VIEVLDVVSGARDRRRRTSAKMAAPVPVVAALMSDRTSWEPTAARARDQDALRVTLLHCPFDVIRVSDGRAAWVFA